MPAIPEKLNKHADKTVELIVYISTKLREKPTYGSTLLGKALYLIDSMSFLRSGKPITELSYIKQQHGPTPNPKQFLPLRDDLVKKGDLEKIDVAYFGRTQNRYIASRKPNITVFNSDEIVLIDEVLENISDFRATEISELSHQFIAWRFANNKEELPFYTFLLSHIEPDPKDYTWAKKAIKAYKSPKNAS